jgi:hypothetical protein
MFWNKKQEKKSFVPSEYVKNYILTHARFSDEDNIKLGLTKKLLKKLNINVPYDVLHDALDALDNVYNSDAKPVMKVPSLPTKEQIKEMADKTLIIKDLKKEFCTNCESMRKNHISGTCGICNKVI